MAIQHSEHSRFVKCKQLHWVFELKSSCPPSRTVPISKQGPLSITHLSLNTLSIYISLSVYLSLYTFEYITWIFHQVSLVRKLAFATYIAEQKRRPLKGGMNTPLWIPTICNMFVTTITSDAWLPSRLVLYNTRTVPLQKGKPPNKCPEYDSKQHDGEVSVVLDHCLGYTEYPFIAIAPRSTLARSGSIW